ncbi:unnamed protein product [Phaedon cochleariae]|uniref:Peptidase S1 domain-containing protein n=1 Tax=Phaedon cochleariae TaxID=80249 RepID=A0A9P0GLR0_PHACE|nr:unnamed protein product [Phaedon cochleariae]
MHLLFRVLFCFLTAASVAVAAAQQKCGSRSVQWRAPRVVGGEEPPLGAVPWQVDLRSDGRHSCGGALIGRRLVVTAAHCFGEDLVAVAGAHGPPGSSPYEQHLRVERFIPHPDFRKLGHYSHDLAILLVSTPGFEISKAVKPACLSNTAPISSGTWCEISGWGIVDPLNSTSYSSVLKSAAVPVISLDTCRRKSVYGGQQQQILDSMLCAGYLKGGIDACIGDSGGPLMCDIEGNLELAGIISWGEGCAKKNRPGIYTRISSFLPWINDVAANVGVDL